MELDTHSNTQLNTQPETETKRCQRCRKTFAIERFIDSDKNPDKVYTKCNDCRLKLVVRKNICETCGIRGCFNFPGETFGRRCKGHSDLGMVDVLHQKCVVCKSTRPNFNFENETKATHCGDCKQAGMVDITNRKCVVCKCTRPTFNFENEDRATHCGDCKQAGMVNVVSSKCVVCRNKIPIFNFENETKATHCGDCKDAGMIDIKNYKCVVCKGTRPTFNFENENKATHCGDCKQAGMVDVLHPKCVVCRGKIPVFNFENEDKATHCGDCKQVGMVDVMSRKCVVCRGKIPVFNFENETRPTHCGDCKDAGMIDIKNYKCVACKGKQPTFNFENEDRATHCGDCKETGMINIKNYKCVVCKGTIPTFNFENETKATHCGDCKQAGMVDIVHRKCHCGTTASYALPGMFPETCSKHKTTGMIIPPRKQCQSDDCKEFATHGIKGPVHCENHAQTDEYLLTERNCQKCNRLDVLNAQGLCVNFCSLEERDRLMKKHAKKKEEFVRKLLKQEIDLKEYVIQEWQDSVIDPTCTKRRPDIVYHCGAHIVIIEVDEDQHKSYSNCGSTREEKLAGENRRMFEIFQIFQGLPVVFLRYNPDGFRVDQKIMKVSDRIRHRVLIQWVKKCLREFQPGLWVKYLYYDDFKETDIHFTQIQEKDVLF